MAFSTSCCLNLTPPTSSSSSLAPLSKSNQISLPRERKEGSWRGRCVAGMACMVIGFEMVALGGECSALPEDFKFINTNAERWSERRMCPPWRANPWEIIVPENLPRPSAHRKYDAVTLSQMAPSVRMAVEAYNNANCFSL